MPHLFVDISAHGFGHLAQTGPVLNALAERLPELHLSIRSGLPAEQLRLRIDQPFDYFHGASDVAFLMHDAVRVDRNASAAAYREAHADWPTTVATEAEWLAGLAPDLVLSNVSCLPLAGAKRAGIPAVAMSSLNWADQFAFLFSGEAWAKKIHTDLLAAYAGADAFLRCTPAMPMPDLHNTQDIPPLSRLGQCQREALEQALGRKAEHLVLLVMGGIGFDMPVGNWPQTAGVRWLVREPLRTAREDVTPYPALGLHFSDLLASVDAIVTKPGYGLFVESAAAGTPVLYLRREDWPEQEVLIDWLLQEGVAAEVGAADFDAGNLLPQLESFWRQPRQPVPANGAFEAAAAIENLLRRGSRSA
ncbi:MAG: hypothetical protein WC023_15810 [Rhodocyclaceae bacterium]